MGPIKTDEYDVTASFGELTGKTIVDITATKNDDDITKLRFVCSDGSKYIMEHFQNCCEQVRVEEIHGDIDDLIGSPVLMAEEVSNHHGEHGDNNSCTWTFYKLATIKGSVTIRWLGTSNGYYSEEVSFYKVK